MKVMIRMCAEHQAQLHYGNIIEGYAMANFGRMCEQVSCTTTADYDVYINLPEKNISGD